MNSLLRAAVRDVWLGREDTLTETLTAYGIDEKRADVFVSWAMLNTKEREGKLSVCLREANELVAFGGNSAGTVIDERLEEQSRRRTDFRRSLRTGARGIWTGQLTAHAVQNLMLQAIARGYTNAWYEGMRRVGLRPEDMSGAEMNALNAAILAAGRHVAPFVAWAEQRTRADGFLLRTLWPRVETWVNGYDAVVNRAAVMAGQDQPGRWIVGDAEHCVSCLKLNGKNKRMSWWKENGILPRVPGAHYLACHGWRCACSIAPNNDPLSRGRMPRLP